MSWQSENGKLLHCSVAFSTWLGYVTYTSPHDFTWIDVDLHNLVFFLAKYEERLSSSKVWVEEHYRQQHKLSFKVSEFISKTY